MIERFKKHVVALLCVFAFSDAWAQDATLYFRRINHANGLSNDKVNCILQDKRGFTWIGTDDGLNRYDGNNFIVYKHIPGRSSSISGNTITDLHEDNEGILWIATADGGITRFNHRLSQDKQFKQYKHQPGQPKSIPLNIINALEEDHEGNLWLATSGASILRFDKLKEEFIQPPETGMWTIFDLCVDKDGIIWAGREGGSIMKVDPRTMQCQIDQRYTNFYAALPHVVVTKLFRDSKQNIWFGSWDKSVYRHNAISDKEESFSNIPGNKYSFGLDEPIAFNEDKGGKIWIGGKYFGLYVFDPGTNNFSNYRHDDAKDGTLSSNTVNCIYVDKSGITWIGTDNGISVHSASQQQFEQQFLPEAARPITIYDFFREKDGPLMIGTNNGIYINQQGGFAHVPVKYKGADLSITCFYRDIDGTLYIGTDYTLFKFDTERRVATPMPNSDKDPVMSKLIESRILSIARDTIDGHPVLLTTPYGHFFSYYDLVDKKWVSRKDSTKNILSRYGITDNLIRQIIKTKDGNLWLANAKMGLILLNKNDRGHRSFINNPSKTSSISNNNVYEILEDRSGNLWISTYGGGLNYFNTRSGTFELFGSAQNLLEGLESDDNGNIWTITNGGVQKFDPRRKTFSYFEMPDVAKSGGVKGKMYKDHNGMMYVSGPGYFISFDPLKIVTERKQPEVYLTDFGIFNHSFSHLLSGDKIALKHTENFFTIHFSAPFYAASAPVQYSYMLEGVDKDWINAGSLTQAPYTNLSGGEYLFKVRATSTPGSWSEKITTVKIMIIPPYWKRWWFFVVIAACIATISYAMYRYRINELLKRQAIRNRIAQDLHDNVGSTLSSISIYSQVAKIYKQKDRQDELQHTLEKISSTSGEMISEMNDIVWAINPRNDNMETILQRMESYAKPLLNTQGIQYQFIYDPELVKLNLQMETRKNFFLIFKESVNNAVKYSGCENLYVRVERSQNQVILKVRDDGKGFDLDEAELKAVSSMSGNGLNNMRRRAKEMKGVFLITGGPGRGTTVELRFPAV
jgi:signal transduction histidine kinase/ligand-binding sensor domain-containing protein